MKSKNHSWAIGVGAVKGRDVMADRLIERH
jgi:hypothetical protein